MNIFMTKQQRENVYRTIENWLADIWHCNDETEENRAHIRTLDNRELWQFIECEIVGIYEVSSVQEFLKEAGV